MSGSDELPAEIRAALARLRRPLPGAPKSRTARAAALADLHLLPANDRPQPSTDLIAYPRRHAHAQHHHGSSPRRPVDPRRLRYIKYDKSPTASPGPIPARGPTRSGPRPWPR